ncbi:MAG: PilZ domain-containing protein [Henriciella sp.]|uniref:PilZ domain-containing protein n=1 Tax=Henriciella sp. TaxID=1968823 RepID=UPI003C77BF1B
MALSSLPFVKDKRQYLRLGSTKSAELVEAGVIVPRSVRLVNISSAGARLKLDIARPVQDTFDLVIHPTDEFSRKSVKCQLQWQRGTDLGVKFI